jgi:hypothetical protein
MNAVLYPIVSEFETKEQEANYDQWSRVKVEAMLDERRKTRASSSLV